MQFRAVPRAWRVALYSVLGVVAVLGFVRIVTRNRDWATMKPTIA